MANIVKIISKVVFKGFILIACMGVLVFAYLMFWLSDSKSNKPKLVVQ